MPMPPEKQARLEAIRAANAAKKATVISDTQQNSVEIKSTSNKEEQRREMWRLDTLYELRMEDLRLSRIRLSKEANKFRIRASLLRYILIILGAVVAAKGIVDQLMLTYQANPTTKLIFDIAFTIVGLVISTLAWTQDALNPSGKAAGLMELSARAIDLERRFMSRACYAHTTDEMQNIIDEQNEVLALLYDDATRYDVDLSLGSKINFSEPIVNSTR